MSAPVFGVFFYHFILITDQLRGTFSGIYAVEFLLANTLIFLFHGDTIRITMNLVVIMYEALMKEAGQDKAFLARTMECAEEFKLVSSEAPNQ